MTNIKVEKGILRYVERDFSNQMFSVKYEDETHIDFAFDINDLVSGEEIKSNGEGTYNLAETIAKEKIRNAKEFLKSTSLTKENQNNLLFLTVYLKIAIDNNLDAFFIKEAQREHLRNLFILKLITLQGSEDIEIIIKDKNNTAVFRNLTSAHYFYKKINPLFNKYISIALLSDEQLNILNNSTATIGQIQLVINQLKGDLPEYREYLILDASITLINFLNDVGFEIRKNAKLGTERQLTLITNLLQSIGLKIEFDSIKIYRERIRDYQQKMADLSL